MLNIPQLGRLDHCYGEQCALVYGFLTVVNLTAQELSRNSYSPLLDRPRHTPVSGLHSRCLRILEGSFPTDPTL